MKQKNLFSISLIFLILFSSQFAFAKGHSHSSHSSHTSKKSSSSSHKSKSYNKKSITVHYVSKKASDVKIESYKKSNGKLVKTHMKSKKDQTKQNNFSTKGNVNPYTNKKGTVDPNKH